MASLTCPLNLPPRRFLWLGPFTPSIDSICCLHSLWPQINLIRPIPILHKKTKHVALSAQSPSLSPSIFDMCIPSTLGQGLAVTFFAFPFLYRSVLTPPETGQLFSSRISNSNPVLHYRTRIFSLERHFTARQSV